MIRPETLTLVCAGLSPATPAILPIWRNWIAQKTSNLLVGGSSPPVGTIFMKYYISYFGQMRNFPPNLLPVSTVMWEQPWFAGTVEKLDELIVPQSVISHLEAHHEMCQKNCPLSSSLPCGFMTAYLDYLRTLDFNQVLMKLSLMTLRHPRVDSIALMVYEKPSCKCAERPCLQQWFKENGIELKEWEKLTAKKETSLF